MHNLAIKNSSILVNLGLSQLEARIYELLLQEGASNIKYLAKKLKLLPNVLYRITEKLINKGLITSSGSYPAIYKAVSPSIAFDIYAKNKIREIEIIKESFLANTAKIINSDQTRIDIIKNTRNFFLEYANLAASSKKEVLIISVGEDVPEEVLLANRDALEKGVNIKFIAHKYEKSNRDLLLRWKKMGLAVRHFKDSGFHIVVIDKSISLLAVSDPNNSNDRMAMKIYSKGLSKAFTNYFDSIWQKAEEIN